MKVTIPYIEQKFDEFNRQMFAGKLPTLPIELSNAKTFLGMCVYQRRRLPNGETEHYNFRLRINTRIEVTEQELEDTIIHEMIHYYIGVNHLKDSSSHGTLFRRIMQEINDRYGRHLTISHKSNPEQREHAYDTRPHWHVVALVRFKDGKTGVKVLPRVIPRILHYYNAVLTNPQVSEIKLWTSNDIYFNRFPNSSALRVAFVPEEEVMPHLRDARPLHCDGRCITPTNGRQ